MRTVALLLATLALGCGPNHTLCRGVSGMAADQQSVDWVAPGPSPVAPTVIDCAGATRGRLDVRRSNTTVRNCVIEGDVRVWGLVRNLNSGELRERSYQSGYVDYVRENAPTGVVIEDVTIIGAGTIPLFISPGVTFTTVRNVTIRGSSVSTMVYLSAESHGTVIEGSSIDASGAAREAVAIDASDYNTITGTSIRHRNGGIYLYRNCGEGGTSRHATPSHNEISWNTFSGSGDVAVWMGSREGARCYCDADSEGSYGSARSDMDHARHNTGAGNSLGGQWIRQGRTGSSNTVTGWR